MTYQLSPQTGELKFANSWELKAAIELSSGTVIPVTFRGRRLRLVQGLEFVESDPVYVTIAAGDYIWVRTFANRLTSAAYTDATGETGLLAATQSYWPRATDIRGTTLGTGEGVSFSTSTDIDPFTLDKVDSGTVSSSDTSGLKPCAIVGLLPKTSDSSIYILGDSIATGSGDLIGGGTINNGLGFIYRAMNPNRALMLAAVGGDQALQLPKGGLSRRLAYSNKAAIAVLNMGTNDIAGSEATAAETEAYLANLWDFLYKNGLTVYQCTIFPRSTSTDGWKTTANQSVNSSFNAARNTVNDWIRSGAPLHDGVPTSTSDPLAVKIGDGGHPLHGFFETADTVETARNAGIWKAGETAVESGTATGGSTSTLIDSGKSWTTNQWYGYTLFNLTTGYYSQVLSNNGTTLTVSPSMSGANAAGHSYELVEVYTVDGTHPTATGHAAASVAVSL